MELCELCIGISSAYYEKLHNDIKPWHCPNYSNELSFSDMIGKDLRNTIHIKHISLMHQKKTKELINKFQILNNFFDQSENTISCDYCDLKDFQRIGIIQQDFSLLHLNISWLSCHINNLVNLLALLNTKFVVIYITETRLSHKNPLTTNIELPGYNTEQRWNRHNPKPVVWTPYRLSNMLSKRTGICFHWTHDSL